MDLELKPDYNYTVKELAFIWNLDSETVRRMFIKEPGVMVFRNQLPGRRIYRTIRIPGHVALRVAHRATIARQAS